MKIRQFKQELKELAQQIKTSKAQYKEAQRAGQYAIYCRMPSTLKDLSYTYRHRHIAYCLLRGKAYEKVEQKVKENNEPNWSLIYSIMDQYRETDPISCGDSVI